MVTKTYLKSTYLPTCLCDSIDSSYNSDINDSSDRSDSLSLNQKLSFIKTNLSLKNIYYSNRFSHLKSVVTWRRNKFHSQKFGNSKKLSLKKGCQSKKNTQKNLVT